MPACASEGCTSGPRFRSSSPPNSRSNSASPPLTWPSLSTAASGSPGQVSPIGTLLKRTISNLSNSSLSRANFTSIEQTTPTSFSTEEPTDFVPSFAENRSCCQHARDREWDEKNENTSLQNHGNVTSATRILRRRQDATTTTIGNDVVGPGGGGNRRGSRSLTGLFIPTGIIVWYVNLALTLIRRAQSTLNYVIWAPIIWISAWICLFWVIVQLPLNTVKWFITAIFVPSSERGRNKRCVLINGGSTLQALHLARNFYKAGARVVICEIEGPFGLARFSTACASFYTVPRPGPRTAAEYVNALRQIVKTEKVAYYVPVSCTVDAYYDALAKPHLETHGCECFVPGTTEVTALEDPLQLMQRCNSLGLSTPPHYVVNSPEDLTKLYEAGRFAGNDRHVMMSAGPAGMRERTKLIVPSCPGEGTPRNLRQKLENYEISETRPWIIVREPCETRGHQLVTCTTIKNCRVVANVTCRLDESRGLVPEDRPDVDQWIETFFARPFANPINGHVSFKLACFGENGLGLVALGCRVGVPLPYLCLTSVHPRLVWRPCRHFSRKNSSNLIVNERYKRNSVQTGFTTSFNGTTTRIRSTSSFGSGSGRETNGVVETPTTVLDSRDALFVYWDPLPYCAYYHLRLPFGRLAGVIGQRPAQHKPPLAVVR